MNNESKPTPSVINSEKISIGETWDTITTTWQDEFRTWDRMGILINNFIKVVAGIGYLLKQDGSYLLKEDGGRIIINNTGGIINENKP